MFAVNITWYGFYMFFDNTISQKYKNNESALSFRLSEHYAWVRQYYSKNMIRNFAMVLVHSYYACQVAYGVPFFAFAGTPNGKGRLQSLWGAGILNYVLCVTVCHMMYLTVIRDYNKWVILCGLFVYLNLPFYMQVVNMNNSGVDATYRIIWETVFTVNFWVCYFVACLLMILPIALIRLVSNLITHPQFNHK